VMVVDPRYVVPVDPELVALAGEARLVVTLEDNGRAGGAGATLAAALRDADVDTPVKDLGLDQSFLHHGERPQLLAEAGLDVQAVTRSIVEAASRREPAMEHAES